MARSAELAASLLLRGFKQRDQYRVAPTRRKSIRSIEITAMPGGVELHGLCVGPLLVPPLRLAVFAAGEAVYVGSCCWMYGVDETAVVVAGVDGWYTFAWLVASQGMGSVQGCVVGTTRG